MHHLFFKWRPFLLFAILMTSVILIMYWWNRPSRAKQPLDAWAETNKLILNDLSSSLTKAQNKWSNRPTYKPSTTKKPLDAWAEKKKLILDDLSSSLTKAQNKWSNRPTYKPSTTKKPLDAWAETEKLILDDLSSSLTKAQNKWSNRPTYKPSTTKKPLDAWEETKKLILDDLSSSFTEAQDCECKVLVRNDNKWRKKNLGCPKNNITVRATLNTVAGNVPMYVYSEDIDIWVSKSIIHNHQWEPHLIKIVTDAMYKDLTLDFIDLGSNVGAYTMTVAKMGRQVLATEALPITARMLCNSVKEARFSKSVPILINNIFSNNRSQFVFEFDPRNIGGTYVVESKGSSSSGKNVVNSAMLDDVLEIFQPKNVFMKADVQGHELKIFEGGKRFFKEVNVKYIILEMNFMTTEDYKRADKVITFLTKRNMTPFMSYSPNVPIDRDTLMKSKGSQDILWKKLN